MGKLREEFVDVALQDINKSEASISQGCLTEKFVIKVSWVLPPAGILKLNFDGSFLKEMHHGGWGGVKRDNTRQILNQFQVRLNASILMG